MACRHQTRRGVNPPKRWPDRREAHVKILHVLDHSIPLHSGYTFRTAAILREQRKLGWQTFHLTSPKHGGTGAAEEEVDGLHFFRTPAVDAKARLPGVGE